MKQIHEDFIRANIAKMSYGKLSFYTGLADSHIRQFAIDNNIQRPSRFEYKNSEYEYITNLNNIGGVYFIKNLSNKKFYIGSSYDIGYRIKKHLSSLRNNRHYLKQLQQDFINGDKLKFGLLIETKELYSYMESWLLYFHQNNTNLYNKTIRKEMPYLSKDDIKKFKEKYAYSKICANSKKKCWLWGGPEDKDGYGRFRISEDGKDYKIYAHRLSYYIYYNIDPFNLQVCHECDNKMCVNPHHLFLGTDQDNAKDFHNKNIGKNRKVTKEVENKIKELHDKNLNISEISRELKLHRSTIKEYLK